MKRFRVRAVGLGLALAAGTAVAADDEWRAAGQPTVDVTPSGMPGLLPAPLRAVPTGAKADGPIWLPARQPGAVAPAVTPLVSPAAGTSGPVVVLPAVPVVTPAPVQQTQPISTQPTVPFQPQPIAAQPVVIQPQPAPAQPVQQYHPQPVVTQPVVQYQPQPAPQQPVSNDSPLGPRMGNTLGPLPTIPVAPDAIEPPPPAPPVRVAVQPQDPVPQPRPLDPPKVGEPSPMIPPRVPEFLPPAKKSDSPVAPMPVPGSGTPAVNPPANPLPAPRPVDPPAQPLSQPRPDHQPAQPELQPAPPELMIPTGAMEAPGRRGTFGSNPINLSRDYPPLRDLFSGGRGHDEVTIASDGIQGDALTNRYFVQSEYLLWWMPGFGIPVLGTTNANTALNGYLGEPGTTSLLGPGNFGNSTRSGFRIRAGAWLDDCGSCGIDGSFFFLGSQSTSAVFNSNQYPLITRPVFVPNLIPGTNTPLGENGEAVAVPGILAGSLSARATSQLLGADVNARKNLLNTCDSRAEVFIGYRFLNLRESLTMTEDITVVGSGGNRVAVTDPIGTHVVVQDKFATNNYFNGGQIGGLYERRFGRWQFDARGSFAMGDTTQVLNISGFQIRQAPGASPMSYQGGLLAAGPNLGRFTSNHFSVVPELTLNVGYWVTPGIRLYAGYNFLLWTNVIRPGDQIDHVVDLASVPNSLVTTTSATAHPRPIFKQTDLVVNGIQFGIDLRW